MPTLFESVKLGVLELANRAVMAPMTRARASTEGLPSRLASTYYAQRTGAGRLITEGTHPGAAGQGYLPQSTRAKADVLRTVSRQRPGLG